MKRRAVIAKIKKAARRRGLGFSESELTRHTEIRVGKTSRTLGRHSEIPDGTARILRPVPGRTWKGVVAMTRPTFTVKATRASREWWGLEVDGVGVSQVRSLADAAEEMREAIAYIKKIPADSFDITVDVQLPEEFTAHSEAARAERERADEARRKAAEESRAAALVLRAEGLTLKDIGIVMGISYQRAHQLVTA